MNPTQQIDPNLSGSDVQARLRFHIQQESA